MNKQRVEEITKRHIGRLLQRLDEINVPTIVKDAVKAEFWLMSDDIKLELK